VLYLSPRSFYSCWIDGAEHPYGFPKAPMRGKAIPQSRPNRVSVAVCSLADGTEAITPATSQANQSPVDLRGKPQSGKPSRISI
jgi:hypothetical protein